MLDFNPMLDFEEGDLVTAREGAALMHLSVKRFYALYRSLAIKLPRRRLLWDRRDLLGILHQGCSARRRQMVSMCKRAVP